MIRDALLLLSQQVSIRSVLCLVNCEQIYFLHYCKQGRLWTGRVMGSLEGSEVTGDYRAIL